MFILYRYVLKKLLGPFLFGIATLSFIFLTQVMIKQISILLSKDVSVIIVFELLGLNIAWILALAVPMSVLLTCLMTFGKLSAENEITAMRANGVGVHQLMIPIVGISILLSIGMYYFNDIILPEVNIKQKTLMRQIYRKNPKLQFVEGVISDDTLIPNYSILLETIDDKSDWVYGVSIFDRSDDFNTRTIIAEKATFTFIEAQGIIRFVLYNGEIHDADLELKEEYRQSKFEKQILIIPVKSSDLAREGESSRGNRSKTTQMLKDDIVKWEDQSVKEVGMARQRIKNLVIDQFLEKPEFEEVIDSLKIENFVKKDGSYFLRDEKNSEYIKELNQNNNVEGIVNRVLARIEYHESLKRGNLVEIYKKYSIPFACVVFVFVGIPLGVKSRIGGLALSGGVGVLLFVMFWSFLVVGEKLSEKMFVEPWLAMWAGDIVIGSIGIYLTFMMMKETGSMDSNIFTKISTLASKLIPDKADDKDNK